MAFGFWLLAVGQTRITTEGTEVTEQPISKTSVSFVPSVVKILSTCRVLAAL
jgi:hypothetical protein